MADHRVITTTSRSFKYNYKHAPSSRCSQVMHCQALPVAGIPDLYMKMRCQVYCDPPLSPATAKPFCRQDPCEHYTPPRSCRPSLSYIRSAFSDSLGPLLDRHYCASCLVFLSVSFVLSLSILFAYQTCHRPPTDASPRHAEVPFVTTPRLSVTPSGQTLTASSSASLRLYGVLRCDRVMTSRLPLEFILLSMFAL
jgi:hypothetical protein